MQHIIEERRKSGALGTINDLLDRMLTGVDRQSGEKLDETNIIAQCITFLVAGHETTSGLLSFALYALIKNPEVLARGYEEVDRVLGPISACRRPTPRRIRCRMSARSSRKRCGLWPTAPAFTRRPYEDIVLGGKYRILRDSTVVVLTPMLHRDTTIWGDDPEAFDPDRFSPENRAKIPPNAYKPFGTGQRACIGRQFALQEAALVLSMLLQRFEFDRLRELQTRDEADAHHQARQLHNPGEDALRARGDCATRSAEARSRTFAAAAPDTAATAPPVSAAPAAEGAPTPLLVQFGSNLGTAEALPTESQRTREDADLPPPSGRSTSMSALCRRTAP